MNNIEKLKTVKPMSKEEIAEHFKESLQFLRDKGLYRETNKDTVEFQIGEVVENFLRKNRDNMVTPEEKTELIFAEFLQKMSERV